MRQKTYNIKVREIGVGPFVASFSLLRGFLKYLPVIYNLLLGLSVLLDKLLFILMNNNPKLIYPIGYTFSATKK